MKNRFRHSLAQLFAPIQEARRMARVRAEKVVRKARAALARLWHAYLERRRRAPVWHKTVSWLVIFAIVAMQTPYITVFLPEPLERRVAPLAQAATVTWDGGGGADTNWSTCANWSGDTCPGSGDIATFDATSGNNVTINSAINVAGIAIAATYTGTITQSAAITVGSSGWTQSGAIFTGGSQAIGISGAFKLAGGTFTATSGTLTVGGAVYSTFVQTSGTFNHNNGTVVLAYAGSDTSNNLIDVPTSVTFYNLTLNTGSWSWPRTISAGDTVVVSHTFYHQSGTFYGGTLEVAGDVTLGSDSGGGSTLLKIVKAGDQTIEGNGNIILPFRVSKPSGTLSLGTTDIRVGGAISTITIDAGNTLRSTSATLTLSEYISWDDTAGGTFLHNNGTVKTLSNGATFDFATSERFYNFTYDCYGADACSGYFLTIASGDNLVVENQFTLTDGVLKGGTLEARGNVIIASGADGGTASLTLSGSTANQIIEDEGGTPPGGTWKIMKSAGVATLSGSLTLNASGQDLVVGSGTLVMSGSNLTVNDVLEVGSQGTVQLRGAEKIAATTKTLVAGSTIKFTGDGDGAADTYPVTNHFGASYKNLRIHSTDNATDTFTLTGALTVAGTLSINSGSILSLGGYNLVNTGGSYTSSGTLRLQGGETLTNFTNDTNSGLTEYVGTSSYTGLAAGNNYYNLTFNGTGGSWTLNSALTANGSLTLSAGTLDVSASNYPVTVGGSWTDTASGDQFTPRSGTVTFSGTGSITSNEAFYGVIKAGAGTLTTLGNTLNASGALKIVSGTLSQGSRSVTAAALNVQGGAMSGSTADLDVNGALTLTGGTLIAPTTGVFTVSGSWLKKAAATFTSGSGTVTLDGGNQTLSGSTTFWNLTKSVTTARTLTFAAGTTQTVAGTLTLNGAASNLLSLRSSQTGNQWKLNPIRTRTIGYVDVKDSNNTNATAITCSDNCVTSGNNTNWTFPWTGTVYTNEGSTVIGANKTVALSINGGAKTTAETDASGAFSIVVSEPSAGNTLTFFLDDETEEAVTVSITDTLARSGFNLYQNRLILRADSGSSVLANTHLATADNSGDADISDFYTLDGSNNLTVHGNRELLVWTGDTFTPGAGVSVGSGADINGTLTLGSNPLTLSGALDLAGGTMTTSGLVTLDGTGLVTLASNGQSFQNLTIAGNGGRVTLADALDVNGVLLIGTGARLRAAGKTIDITGGSFSNHGILELYTTETLTGFTNDYDSGTVRFIGSGSYTTLANLTQFSALTFSGAGTWNLKQNIRAGSGITFIAGTVTGTGGLTLSGSLVTTGGTYRGTGTVIFDGSGVINHTRSLSGVILSAAGTYTLANPLSVSGTLILRSGTLDVSSSNHSITLAKSWEKESNAIFTGRSGSVIFSRPLTGTGQTLSGSTLFWNLTKQNGSGHTLFFGAGATQTVGGTWTALGTSAKNIKLLSTTNSTQWKVNPLRTRTLQYVTVQDSNNTNSSTILCANDCTNGGNNSSWAFPIAVTVYSNTGTTLMGAGKTVAVAVNGNIATKATADTNASGVATFTSVGLAPGDIVTIWLDDETEKGVTISKTNATTLGFDLFTNVVQVQAEQGSTITGRNVGTGALISDTDISSLITTATSGTGITIDMPNTSSYDIFRIKSGDTFRLNGYMTGATLDINGTLESSAYDMYVLGSWDATGGSFNLGNKVSFETDRQRYITSNGNAFNRVEFRIPSIGSLGQWFITDGITISTASTIVITGGSTNVNGPNISNISATAYDERATIAWATDIIADSKVVYSTNSGSLTNTVSSGADVLSHSLSLTGLTKATKYWFKVVSQDASNRTTTGSLLSFNTLPLSGDAPTISDIAATANATTATITWTTNKSANSNLSYGTTSGSLTSSASSGALSTSHSLSLSGLSRGTRYYFRVASTAVNGLTATGAQMDFLTLGYTQSEYDSAISTAQAAGKAEGVGVTTEVRQGGGGGGRRQVIVEKCMLPEKSPEKPADILKNLRSLLPQRVSDVLDKLLTADTVKELAATFETLVPFLRRGATGPAMGGAPNVDVTGMTATISWATLEPGSSFVEYAPDSRFASEGYIHTDGDPDAETRDHAVTLEELTPGALYHYRVRSGNKLLASSFSDDFTFAIPAAPPAVTGQTAPGHAAAPSSTEAVSTAQPAAYGPELPFVISNYNSVILSPQSAAFSWDTALPTTTRVIVTPYGANGAPVYSKAKTVSQDARTVAHAVTISEFDPGVLYAVQIGGTDSAGREVLRIDPEFTTDPKRSPAQIAGVTTDAFLNAEQKDAVVVVISWTTTKETMGRVLYREGVTEDSQEAMPFSSAEETTFGRTHSVMLRGLSPGAVYSFRIESRDLRGTAHASNTFTLLTPKEDEGIFRVILTQLEEVFGWLRIFTSPAPGT